MRTKICALFVATLLMFSMVGGATAQSFDSSARSRTGEGSLTAGGGRALNGSASTQTASNDSVTLESLVPRDGLRLYVEIRNGGLAELVKSSATIGSFAKLLSSGAVKTTTTDLASFVMANLGLLSRARIALAGYDAGALVVIEAASPADAEQLQTGVAALLGSRKGKASGAEVETSRLGRMVIATPKQFAVKLSQSGGAVTLSQDQEFVRARGRFEQDQFFAYVDFGSISRSLFEGQASQSPAYTMGAMAALSGLPSAIVIGGSIAGEVATVRALIISGAPQKGGMFSSLFSSLSSAAQTGQPTAGAFASTDADVFVDVMLDWDKLYDSIESMLAMFAGSLGGGSANAGVTPAQGADILGVLETSLGFSIKNDLLPTLGGEVAFTLSGLGHTLSPKQAITGTTKPASPRFMFMVALKDPTGFEKLISRLLNRSTSAAAQFTHTPYRAVMVNANKTFAYAIVNGFFVAGGSAAQIRRAIDAQATGVSLASTDSFKSAFGSTQAAALQAYISPSLASELFEAMSREAVKSSAPIVTASAAQARMPIAIQLIPGEEGMMIEAQLPSNLAFQALASMASGSSGRSTRTPLPAGVGVSEPGPRVSGSSRTPRMTDDDLRRKP